MDAQQEVMQQEDTFRGAVIVVCLPPGMMGEACAGLSCAFCCAVKHVGVRGQGLVLGLPIG